MRRPKGFTLVELIIVIAIIAILAGAIFVAIDPARRLHEARNARRSNDIVSILDALKTFQVDNGGDQFPAVASLTVNLVYQIGTDGSGCDRSCGSVTTEGACVDLSDLTNGYLSKIPLDPRDGTNQITGYAVKKNSYGALTVYACGAESESAGGEGTPPEISITR